MNRQTVAQLIASQALPEIIDSYEDAARWAPILTVANARFNTLYALATMQTGPDTFPEPFKRGEERAWVAGLDALHALQAQAFGWHLAALLLEAPGGVVGLGFSQEDCRASPTRHATQLEMIEREGAWAAPTDLDKAFAAHAKETLDKLPDLTAFAGRDLRWSLASKTVPLAEAARALIASQPGTMTAACFARWEAASLAKAAAPALASGKRARI